LKSKLKGLKLQKDILKSKKPVEELDADDSILEERMEVRVSN
jgi:hypothetical protein